MYPGEVLPELLENIGRASGVLGQLGFSALGLNLNLDATAAELLPDPSYLPDFKKWEQLTADEAREQNQDTRRPLRNGSLSPGCQVYLERKRELSIDNEDGFSTVRRLPAPVGKPKPRLGTSYEFFRCLELFTGFWDDPTKPPDLPPSPEMSASAATSKENRPEDPTLQDENRFIRTGAGHSMPAEYRQNLIAAFVKLIAYEFGCNVSMARVEPRLHLTSPAGSRAQRKTYCPSSCSFVFQSPMTRETARAGLVYGPVAAVSSRPTVDFTVPSVETAQSLDLAREIVAALITAQHHAREGKTETRFGDGQWWATKPRWGGAPGGPIGREIEKDAILGDKDAPENDADGLPMPAAKRPRKNMAMYDNYRMVRPPASTWDKKARYEAIGRQAGAGHDDVFVISSLFHHVSVLRVRVPLRLLDVLDGSPEPDPTERSWGRLQAWRSPWYDLFDTPQRIAAMQLLWAVMAYQMRKETGDVEMDGA